jgi:predicted molibdopterin-dependent oxidoreductase YjgC
VVFNDLPGHPLDDELVELLNRLDFCAVFQLARDPRLAESVLVIPATTFGEKSGTMINEDGRLQRVQVALQPPRNLRYEHELLQEVLVRRGARDAVVTPATLFKEIVGECLPELDGRTHRDVGDFGIQLREVRPGSRVRAEASNVR